MYVDWICARVSSFRLDVRCVGRSDDSSGVVDAATSSAGVAGAVVLCVATVFYGVTTALYYQRRHLFPVKARFPSLTLFGTIWGYQFMAVCCLQQILGMDYLPCAVVLWSANLLIPLYAFPYIRTCAVAAAAAMHLLRLMMIV